MDFELIHWNEKRIIMTTIAILGTKDNKALK